MKGFSKSKKFNLIEVTLAMGIAVIALVILTGMLPVGMKNTRDAISTDLASNLANGFADFLVEENSYATLESYDQSAIDSSTAMPIASDYDSTAYSATLFGDTIFAHSSNDQFFKLEFPVYDKSGTATKFKDLDGEMRVWTQSPKLYSASETMGFSSRREDDGGSTITTSDITTLFIEVSWPLNESNYGKRQKITIVRDITNR